MQFADLLQPGLIRIAPPWRTFDETIGGLVDALVDGGMVPAADRDDVVQAVIRREAEASTALLEIAVGVPHARLRRLSRTVGALALSAAGLYEPVPTAPIGIVALVLSPAAAVNEHLRLLADIGTTLRSASLRHALRTAADATTALRLLTDHARSVG